MTDNGDGAVERQPSMLEHAARLAPGESETREGRLAYLHERYMDMADATTSHADDTLAYVMGGGSLRLCLSEIMALSNPCAEDEAVHAARTRYMDYAFRRRGLAHRGERKQIFRSAEEEYIEAVANKLGAMIDASTSEDALKLGQMPTLIGSASFQDGHEVTKEELAANHLYLLVDTALKEHAHRRHAIDRERGKGILARAMGSHTVHMSIAGVVFAAAVTPRLGVLPPHDLVADNVEFGLKVLSGTALGVSAPEAVRLKYLQVKHDGRTEELRDQLASSRELSDQALRMTYNATRYGGPDGSNRVTGRSGTESKEENLKRFVQMDADFVHLNNDPGGKPYTGEQALGYAARLLIERQEQLESILSEGQSAEARRAKYLQLAKEILTEDVIRMKKGLNVSRMRRRIIGALAIVPAMIFPSVVSSASEASSLGREAAGTLVPHQEGEHDA